MDRNPSEVIVVLVVIKLCIVEYNPKSDDTDALAVSPVKEVIILQPLAEPTTRLGSVQYLQKIKEGRSMGGQHQKKCTN